jgi:hypothetical protein
MVLTHTLLIFFLNSYCQLYPSKLKVCLKHYSAVYVFCSFFLRCTSRSLYSFLNSTHHQFCICECGVCWQWGEVCILVLASIIRLILWEKKITCDFFFLYMVVHFVLTCFSIRAIECDIVLAYSCVMTDRTRMSYMTI